MSFFKLYQPRHNGWTASLCTWKEASEWAHDPDNNDVYACRTVKPLTKKARDLLKNAPTSVAGDLSGLTSFEINLVKIGRVGKELPIERVGAWAEPVALDSRYNYRGSSTQPPPDVEEFLLRVHARSLGPGGEPTQQ